MPLWLVFICTIILQKPCNSTYSLNCLYFVLDLDDPIVTVHQSIGEAKEQFYYERTVFLRCVANSNPPVRYSWRRGQEVLLQGSDKGVEIYEPFFTQVGIKVQYIQPTLLGYYPNSSSMQYYIYLKRYFLQTWPSKNIFLIEPSEDSNNKEKFNFYMVIH